jgi:hypothetical protein
MHISGKSNKTKQTKPDVQNEDALTCHRNIRRRDFRVHCTITAPLLHHYCTITAPLLHHYCTITAPSLTRTLHQYSRTLHHYSHAYTHLHVTTHNTSKHKRRKKQHKNALTYHRYIHRCQCYRHLFSVQFTERCTIHMHRWNRCSAARRGDGDNQL